MLSAHDIEPVGILITNSVKKRDNDPSYDNDDHEEVNSRTLKKNKNDDDDHNNDHDCNDYNDCYDHNNDHDCNDYNDCNDHNYDHDSSAVKKRDYDYDHDNGDHEGVNSRAVGDNKEYFPNLRRE